MIKHIIFDFDGVIVDSYDYHLGNINKLPGVSVTAQEYDHIMNGNFFDSDLAKLDWSLYEETMSTGEVLEIKDVVKDFLSQGYKNYIVSSGSTKIIMHHLESNDAAHHFTEVLCKEDEFSKVKKFNYLLDTYGFSKEETVFITDTVGDVKEAHEVGIRTIAVDFGFQSRESLLGAEPHMVCSDWDCVQSTIDSLSQPEKVA